MVDRGEPESETRRLRREVRRLKVYLFGTVLLVGALGLLGSGPPEEGPEEFETVRAERIDIVEPDGTRRLVLSNRARFPNPVLDGEELERSIKPAGMVHYDRDGSEMGGIAALDPDGPARWTAVVFDYENSEAIGFSSRPRGEEGYGAGITIADRIPLDADMREVGTTGTSRVEIENEDGDAAVVLSDPAGNPRIRLYVGADGRAGVEVLSDEGEVVDRLGS